MASSLAQWVARRGTVTPESVALVAAETGERITYADLERRVARRAATLRELGVRKGDRVALLGLNSTGYLETLFAAAWLGAITLPINFRLTAPEIEYLLDDARPAVVVHDDTFAALAKAASGTRTLVNIGELGRTEDRVEPEPTGADEVAVLMYTSGTTGRPKGAMLTHGNLEANAINVLTSGEGILPSDVTLTVAPLFHIGGLALFTLPLLYAGGTVVVAGKFDPQETLALLQREKITVHFMVPAMWAAMTQVPDFDSYDLSRLRYLLCGGAPCPLPVIEFYEGKGLTFVEGFGMTELSPAALVLESAFVRSRAGSVGRPFLHVEARIVDERDDDVPAGTVGELVLRGPNVFAGYWGLPEASAETMRGGWFHSGDLARRDADGFVTLVDRKKDMIISGGENVYPIEVEQVLHRHPDIADVAVIGAPDPQWGETVVAVVVPAAGSLDGDAVIAYCRERIAAFKCPRRVEIVDELPRNATGKLLKRELRARYTSSAESVSR
ncbi:o-succinylbenzoate--CoA ligase [Amycolatopsis sp. AA4]|uniref:acyl-CoA synthetase n=1 Tax=Actinomycetes TaxID=1760 RepID=UPI0001B55596|nr:MULTISPECIES: long-chain fatty acid--CoA ligase [Actinomycetes]ATY11644.1 o-succinylbenzoate--CoA ligase [Amycolatopsis sp. AA4]EFL07298.1 O-succinylbenzoate-CoA ligase [Streptomyces sp. AA4]